MRGVRASARRRGDAPERRTWSPPPSGSVPDERLHEPPQRVSAQPDGDRDQQPVAERLLLDGLQRAALIGGLAGLAWIATWIASRPMMAYIDAAGDESGPVSTSNAVLWVDLRDRRAGLCVDAAHAVLSPFVVAWPARTRRSHPARPRAGRPSPSCALRRRARRAPCGRASPCTCGPWWCGQCGDRSRLAGDRAADGARPLGDAVGGDHRQVEQAVVGLGVGEHPHAAEQRADVSGQDAARRPLYQGLPSTRILALNGAARKLFVPVHR